MLVVEDDSSTRWLHSEILRSRGHRVVAAADAASAWDAFAAHPPSLVMIDLGLPDGDGLELCRRVRAHPDGLDAVILVVTGRTEPRVLQGSLDAGADDYLAKPVGVAHLHIRLAVAEREVARRLENRSDQQHLASQSDATRALLDNLDEVTFSFDPHARAMLRVSPAMLRVLGRAPDELSLDGALWRTLLSARSGGLAGGAAPGISALGRPPLADLPPQTDPRAGWKSG